jgi:hypothetical protein
VSPTSPPPTRHHPGTPPVLVGNTLPPVSPHHAAIKRITASAWARAARGDRTVSVQGARPISTRRGSPPRLGGAARPWPSPSSARPRMAGRRVKHHWQWADVRPVTVRRFFLSFFNCFKFQKIGQTSKFVETCRNVQNFRNKFCGTPLEPLFTVGLTKLAFMH